MKKYKRRTQPLVYYLPLSAKTGKNCETLQQVIVENLPCQPAFYEKDTLTDFPLKFRVSDIVREQLCLTLKKELPHSAAVEVEEIEERETLKKTPLIYIKVNIYVNRDSQKKIVIGKKGRALKEIGRAARPPIQKIVGKKVFLDIWVKVLGDWQQRPRILQELGYWIDG